MNFSGFSISIVRDYPLVVTKIATTSTSLSILIRPSIMLLVTAVIGNDTDAKLANLLLSINGLVGTKISHSKKICLGYCS